MSEPRFFPEQKAKAREKGISLVFIHIDGSFANPKRGAMTFRLPCPPEREKQLCDLIVSWFKETDAVSEQAEAEATHA
jgi:hypothetical protein